MKGGDIATVIVGVLGFLGTMYGTWRVARSDKLKHRSEDAAVLLSGWKEFQAQTQMANDLLRAQFKEEMAALKTEHEADKAEWRAREQELREEIEMLKAQLIILLEKKVRED